MGGLDEDSLHPGEDSEGGPRRNVRRPLPTPDVRRVRLGAAGRLCNLGELHGREPRQDLPPEQLQVVGGLRVRLFPFCERSIVRT